MVNLILENDILVKLERYPTIKTQPLRVSIVTLQKQNIVLYKCESRFYTNVNQGFIQM